jgi:hypothetical protein
VTQSGTGRIPELIGALMEGDPNEKQDAITDEIVGEKGLSLRLGTSAPVMLRAVTIATIISAGSLGLFCLGFFTSRAARG